MTLPPFYPIISTVAAAEAVLDSGARILQYRNKSFFSRQAFEDASRIAELCRQAGALFVVNDRADVALLLDAALHLGQDDLAPADARRILPRSSISPDSRRTTSVNCAPATGSPSTIWRLVRFLPPDQSKIPTR